MENSLLEQKAPDTRTYEDIGQGPFFDPRLFPQLAYLKENVDVIAAEALGLHLESLRVPGELKGRIPAQFNAWVDTEGSPLRRIAEEIEERGGGWLKWWENREAGPSDETEAEWTIYGLATREADGSTYFLEKNCQRVPRTASILKQMNSLSSITKTNFVTADAKTNFVTADAKTNFVTAEHGFLEQTSCSRKTNFVRAAAFSRLAPGAEIRPHTGFTGLARGALVYHLGLLVGQDAGLRCGGVDFFWQRRGQEIVFDDMYEHSAWNRGKTTRIVLYLDFEVQPTRDRL